MTREKQVWEVEGKKKKERALWADGEGGRGRGGWQVVGGGVGGGGPSGCYFLALVDLAEFRGGVTGLPDPIPPPPP